MFTGANFFKEDCFVTKSCRHLRDHLPLMSEQDQLAPEADLSLFRDHYGLTDLPGTHRIGQVPFKETHLALQWFGPDQINHAPVFIVHGYTEHTAINYQLIQALLKAGYPVAAMDMPGHGLSGGERLNIDAFETYGEAVATAKKAFETIYDTNFCGLIGHSTGCSSIFEYLISNGAVDCPVIFAAPLVRFCLWDISKVSHQYLGKFVNKVPRVHRKHSSSQEYINFINKKDVFQETFVPLGWVESLFRWNDKLADFKTLDQNLLVIQGDNDVVVDWKYNVPWLEEHVNGFELYTIEGANHALFNEAPGYTRMVFKKILQKLEAIHG